MTEQQAEQQTATHVAPQVNTPELCPVHVVLARVMADVRKVAKTDRNTQQNFAFRGIDATLNAVGPALRAHGVVAPPTVTDLRYEPVTIQINGKDRRAVQVLVFVTYAFTGPAGDTIEAHVPGEAIDYGDKAVSKAMSVAWRTALLQTLALPTDEPDPDSHSYERSHHTPVPASTPASTDEAWQVEPTPQMLSEAQRIWDEACSAGDLDTIRSLWQEADSAGLLAVLIPGTNGKAPLSYKLRTRAAAFTEDTTPEQGTAGTVR